MKFFGDYSGKKPRSGEERIAGSPLGLPSDPVLNQSQSFGRLVDVVALGDVGKCFEQRVETLLARGRARQSGLTRAYPRYPDDRARSNNLCHAFASPLGAPEHAAEARTPASLQP
jgi:hypothetical protein